MFGFVWLWLCLCVCVCVWLCGCVSVGLAVGLFVRVSVSVAVAVWLWLCGCVWLCGCDSTDTPLLAPYCCCCSVLLLLSQDKWRLGRQPVLREDPDRMWREREVTARFQDGLAGLSALDCLTGAVDSESDKGVSNSQRWGFVPRPRVGGGGSAGGDGDDGVASSMDPDNHRDLIEHGKQSSLSVVSRAAPARTCCASVPVAHAGGAGVVRIGAHTHSCGETLVWQLPARHSPPRPRRCSSGRPSS